MINRIDEFIFRSAERAPDACALVSDRHRLSYAELAAQVHAASTAFLELGIGRLDRVAVYLEKRPETVAALFGAAAAGATFVPVNPLLKAAQVAYILKDCNVKLLVTSAERLSQLAPELAGCSELKTILVIGRQEAAVPSHLAVVRWQDAVAKQRGVVAHRTIDADMAAILYTSGSTGKPKGVVLSHRNLIAGAQSVASYLENTSEDRILSVLPLSFDYGLSQLTTSFYTGGSVVLLNYLLPKDILDALEREKITGMAAVPPLWIQLARARWPRSTSLRYITNSGGAMPKATVDQLRQSLPGTKVFLMYGLTEAFRSTYLPPDELERRPDSIGKAIPNAEVLVLREDGSRCLAGEPGELVHRGALVSMGYWNDPARTAERFKPLPQRDGGLPLQEIAVWSGDTVRMDDDGFLYFISRRDEMIKTSGYRVSPTEIEEVIYATGLVGEAVAIGVPHPVLGQAIVVIAKSNGEEDLAPEALLAACKHQLPAFMWPAHIALRTETLPRNANGKIDRKLLYAEWQHTFTEAGR